MSRLNKYKEFRKKCQFGDQVSAYGKSRLKLRLLTQVDVSRDTSVQIMSAEDTFQAGYSCLHHIFSLIVIFPSCLYLCPYVSECHSESMKNMHLLEFGSFVYLELRSHK